MALFQLRQRFKNRAADKPIGLLVPARAVNNEELMILHTMRQTPDGILSDFVAFEEDGKLGNELLPRAGQKQETELQLFMRLAGLTEIPTLDQIVSIQRAAYLRLMEKYGPMCEEARLKGEDQK
jgi:hypothetical protein